MKFILWRDKRNEWRWTLRNARNGKIIADSAEGYAAKRNAVAMCKKINPNFPRETV